MLNERQQKALEGIPQALRKEVAFTFNNRPRAPQAIRAYCLMCKEGSKAEIIRCEDDICPLRHVRPFISESSDKEPQQ